MALSANEGEVIPVAEAETRHSDEDSAKARAEAYNVRGNETYRRKDFTAAIRFYTEGIEVNCKDDELKAKLYSNRAKAHFRLENFIDSLDDAKVATDLQPSFVKAIISGASACIELKEFEEAVTWCEKGLAIDKENPTLLELRNKSVNEQAKSQEKIEEKDANECKTRSTTEEILDSDANDVNLKKIAELLMNEGNDEFKKRDFSNAVHFYTEGIKVRCKDGELKAKLYSNRSAAYFKLGNFSDSLRDAKIATDLEPSFVKTVVKGASACVQLNRFEEAITWCDKGLEVSFMTQRRETRHFRNCNFKIPQYLKQNLDFHKIDEKNPKLLELRNSCVTEQSRLQQMQGENATEDPLKTHTRNGSLAHQSGTGTNDSRMQRGNSGNLGSNVPNFKTDVEDQERRLKLAEEAGDKEIEGAACANLGNAYRRLGNFKKAIEYHERDLKIAKEANQLVGQGRAYCNLGNAYHGLGDFQKAISCHTRDLQIAKELADVRGEGMAYSNLGNAYSCLGYFKKAVDYHERHLEVAIKTGDKAAVGKAYCNLGSTYYRLGDFRKAVKYHQWDLQIEKDRGDIVGEGKTYCNLGNDYSRLGDLKKAIDYHKLDLEITQEVGDVVGEGGAYCNLGNDFHNLGDFRKAIAYHQRHLEVMKAVGNIAGEGAAYNNLGADYSRLGEYTKSNDYIERFLSIAKHVGDLAGEGKALGNLAIGYENLGDFKKAVVYLERQLQIAKKIGDLQSEGHAYASLGVCYRQLGDFEKAIHYSEHLLKIAKNVGALENEAKAYGNLGGAYQCLGDFKTAKRFFDRALDIARQIGDRVMEAKVHGNLGNAHYSVGNVREAIQCHELSLAVTKEVGDIASEGKAYGNLGTVYYSLGDFRKAVDYHKRQLEIAKRLGDIATEGVAYGNLGNAYDSLGDFKRAIDYHERDLKIAKEVGDIAGEGVTYGNLGNCYHGLGDFHRAIDYFECHLKLAKEVGDRASEGKAYGSLGSAYDSLGDSMKAIEFHERCRQIATETGDTAGEGIALGNIGQAYHNCGDFAKAIHFLERRLEIAKEMGAVGIEGKAYGSLGVTFFRLRDFQKAIECHKRYLEIAKEVGDEVGIGVSSQNLGETYQALGALSEAVHCYHRSVSVFNDVRRHLELNDEWKMSLRNLHHSAYVNLWRSLLEQGKITEGLVAAEQGRAQALKDLLQLNYASEGNRADLGPHNETVNDLLDCIPSNTVFMALEEKEVVFWIFQKGKKVQLRRKPIENYDHDTSTFLESLMKTAWGEINVEAVVKCEDRSLDVQRDGNIADENSSSEMTMTQTTSQGSQKSALAALNEVVISPIQDALLGNEVIFVPEGPLCLAPFAAFMDKDSKYLSESLRVRVIPSLTSMKLIADCPNDYHSKTGSLLVGDPWIQEVIFRGVKLRQLPYAQDEVKMIGRILDTAPLIGRQATKDEVLKRLSSAALVHIAAHGKMQTGEIALAPNPNRKSQVPMEEDFLLTMRDVLNVQMRAQLVVLSCCHSAHGEIKAEGVVGIARAFLGAGARSVLVSLWAIDDDATLEFMRVFYQHLLSGKSASESLNQTMKCMRESNQFNRVKHWAPFVLIGDDVTLELSGHK